MQTPEAVILMAQHKIYELKDELEELKKQTARIKDSFVEAEQKQRRKLDEIKEFAAFLDENSDKDEDRWMAQVGL